MSKRWKVRKRNAAKLEKSREVIAAFYDNVIAGLKHMAERSRSMTDEEKKATDKFFEQQFR